MEPDETEAKGLKATGHVKLPSHPMASANLRCADPSICARLVLLSR